MIDLAACRDRVQTLDYNFVGDTIDAADAMANMAAPVPAAYVSIARESASKNKNATGRHTQMVEQTLSVLLALGAQRADAALHDEVEERKNALIDLFMAWTAPGAGTPFNYASFSIRMIDEGTIWAELLFTAISLSSKDAS